jgi:hypothetical protein
MNSAAGKILLPKCTASNPQVPRNMYMDESSRSSMSSPVDGLLSDRPMKLSKTTIHNQNTDSTDMSSNHSVTSAATSALDLATLDERPPSLLSPDDIEATVVTPRSNAGSPGALSLAASDKPGSSVLRIPTPSSWERLKFSRGGCMPPASDVEMKDTEALSSSSLHKKLCDCMNSKTMMMHCGNCKVSGDLHMPCDNQKVIALFKYCFIF